MKPSLRIYGGASLIGDDDNGVRLVRVGGLVTPASVRAMHVAAAAGANPAAGSIMLWDDAYVAVDAEQMIESALAAAKADDGMQAPVAHLVHQSQLERFRLYALASSRSGLPRAAFLSQSLAQRWLRAQAAVTHDRMQHQKSRPLPRAALSSARICLG